MDFLFSEEFLFGASSSACQIESGCKEGGKGEDVCDHFFLIYPEKFFGGNPNESADFYHHYPKDIEMMKELGLRAFRFSISWSRIFPDGPETVCQAGLDYYEDIIDHLNNAGIEPFFDLWHCDLPYWVIERGGVLNPDFIEWFRIYAKTVFERLGKKVKYWCTINEPSINIMASYAYGANAPFHEDFDEAIRACHNGILAHYAAVQEFKKLNLPGQITAVIHMEPVYPWTNAPEDHLAAKRKQAFYTGWWLDPILKGHYPEILKDYPYIMDKLPKNYQEDLDANFVPVDFIGINYYSPGYARYIDDGKLFYETMNNEKLLSDDYGFHFYPEGLFDMGMYLKETYPGKDIFITENGFGKKKWGNLDEELDDEYRIDIIREHLRSMNRAIQAGVPYKGYFHWTIIDTNELYAGGYNYMFGLTQVNYTTKERRRRKSWYYYQDVIKNRRVD